MSIELTRRDAPALWRYRVRGADEQIHDVLVYGFPSIGRRPRFIDFAGQGEEGPLRPGLRCWGRVAWYEAIVDGAWADPDGHAAYAQPEHALEEALKRLGRVESAPEENPGTEV